MSLFAREASCASNVVAVMAMIGLGRVDGAEDSLEQPPELEAVEKGREVAVPLEQVPCTVVG